MFSVTQPVKYFCYGLIALLALFLTACTSTTAGQQTTSQSDTPAPICAVKNFGPTSCPNGVGTGTANCFVRDSNVVDPKTASTWTKVDCNDPAMTAPVAIDCTKDAAYGPIDHRTTTRSRGPKICPDIVLG